MPELTAADFYYSIQAYEYSDISPIKDTTPIPKTAGYDPDVVNAYTSTEWVLIPSDGKSVNVRNTVQYRIRVYKKTPFEFLGDNDYSGVTVNIFDSWKSSFPGDVSGVKQKPATSGTVFIFNISSKVPVTATPKINVNVGALAIRLNINADGKGKVPTINYTNAEAIPTCPKKEIINYIFPGTTWAVPAAQAGGRQVYYDYSEQPSVPSENYNIEWDACKKQWVVLKVGFKAVTSGGITVGFADSWHIYRFNTAGAPIGSPVKQPNKKRAQQLLLEANAANCVPVPQPSPVPPEGGLTIPSTDNITYNPPAHYVSRGISHGVRVADYESAMRENKSIVIDTFKANSVFSQFVDSRSNLGRIFQSQGAAESMNVATQTKGKVPIFGFKFMYNPQSINYSIPMNTSIDWTLSTQDPANLIAGNIAVNFTLYLNRIADMTELMPLKTAPTMYSKNYPRQLSKEEVEGILLRGTEYDLEFLYRSVNGNRDMTGNSLLTYAGESADKGYITGVPLWFVLHDNLRYYGSLQNISVDHVVFTDKMVPMLSVVNISFLRYPSGANVEDFLKDKNKQDSAIPAADPNAAKTASTGTTTP